MDTSCLEALMVQNSMNSGNNHILNAVRSGDDHILNNANSSTNSILGTLYTGLGHLANSENNGFLHILNDAHAGQSSLDAEINSAERNLTSLVTSNGYRIQDAEARISNIAVTQGLNNNNAIVKVGDDTRNAITNSTDVVRTMIDAKADWLFGSLQDARVDLRDTTERYASELRSQSDRNFMDLRNANDRTSERVLSVGRDLALEMARSEERVIKQQLVDTSAIQNEALKNKNELAREVAETACAIKEKIVNSANETNSLIRKLDEERLRFALSEEKTKSLILGLKLSDCSRCNPQCCSCDGDKDHPK